MIKDTDEGSSIIEIDTLEELIVEEMEDGGMGSLWVVVDGEDNRLFSRELAKVDLFDADQVPVFISVIWVLMGIFLNWKFLREILVL